MSTDWTELRAVLDSLPCPICSDGCSDEELKKLAADIDHTLTARFGTADTGGNDKISQAWWEVLEDLALTSYNMKYYEELDDGYGTYRIKEETPEDGAPPLYWSNEQGWTEENYSLFTEEETTELNLPVGGKWDRRYDTRKTVIRFATSDGCPDIMVAVCAVLTDSQRSELEDYWAGLWEEMLEARDFPDTNEEVVVRALRHFNYPYEIISEDCAFYI